jgi:feruloyl esterase
MSALENRVENGLAPDKLIASRKDQLGESSRPVYPYPILARYSGTGDPRRADNFVPYEPSSR